MRTLRCVVSRLPRQVELDFTSKHGGSRKGAGRKRQSPRPRVPHARRESINRHSPVHVTLRVLDSVGRLRRMDAYRAIRQAMLLAHERPDFRIVHVSIQSNHIHMLCEAHTREALASGMSSLKISAARRINRVLRRRGAVFADRYHSEIIGCPLQARNAICYVLNNWRRHGEDRGTRADLDRFSSAVAFQAWREGVAVFSVDDEQLPVKPAESWLLAKGFAKHAAISCYEVPGQR